MKEITFRKNSNNSQTNVLHRRTLDINCLQNQAPKCTFAWSIIWACPLKGKSFVYATGTWRKLLFHSDMSPQLNHSSSYVLSFSTIVGCYWFLKVLTLHFSFCDQVFQSFNRMYLWFILLHPFLVWMFCMSFLLLLFHLSCKANVLVC